MPAIGSDALDDPLMWEVCEDFRGGQDSFSQPSVIAANQASQLENLVILINGELRKRLGTCDCFYGSVAGAGNLVQALAWYNTTLVQRIVAIADGRAFYYDGSSWVFYFDADISNPLERIDLLQFTDDLYWADSAKTGVRKFDGTTVSTIAGSPPATHIEVVSNRLAALGNPTVPDALYFSAIINPSSWDLVNGSFRIGDGDGSPLMGMCAWQDNSLVVCKRRGVWVVDCNPTIANPTNFSVLNVHKTVGLAGSQRTMHQVGQDMWFLADEGVMSVQKQIATSNNLIAVPVTQPVHDIIKRINWQYAFKSTAICHDNFYLLSVPTDDETEPNTVIVFHYQVGGFTYFRNFRATCFLEQPYLGRKRLLLGCETGEVREWLNSKTDNDIDPNEDFHDLVGFLNLPLTLPFTLPFGEETVSTLVTRALTFGDKMTTKNGYYAYVQFMQVDGTAKVYVILDGGEPILIRSFDFSSAYPHLPLILPFKLPPYGNWVEKPIPLHHLRRFKELQLKVVSDSGDFRMRRCAASAYVNPIDPNPTEDDFDNG